MFDRPRSRDLAWFTFYQIKWKVFLALTYGKKEIIVKIDTKSHIGIVLQGVSISGVYLVKF